MTTPTDVAAPRAANYDDEGKTTVYVLVQTDIPMEQQLVQAAHAVAEAGRSFYDPEHGIASLVVLAVPDQDRLRAARERLDAKGVRTELFFEPDFDIGHSALATEPLDQRRRKLLGGLPLWRARPVPAAEGVPA